MSSPQGGGRKAGRSRSLVRRIVARDLVHGISVEVPPRDPGGLAPLQKTAATMRPCPTSAPWKSFCCSVWPCSCSVPSGSRRSVARSVPACVSSRTPSRRQVARAPLGASPARPGGAACADRPGTGSGSRSDSGRDCGCTRAFGVLARARKRAVHSRLRLGKRWFGGHRGPGFLGVWTTVRRPRSSSISTSCASGMFVCLGAVVIGCVIGYVLHSAHHRLVHADRPRRRPEEPGRHAPHLHPGRVVPDLAVDLDLLRDRARAAGDLLAGLAVLRARRRQGRTRG